MIYKSINEIRNRSMKHNSTKLQEAQNQFWDYNYNPQVGMIQAGGYDPRSIHMVISQDYGLSVLIHPDNVAVTYTFMVDV